MENEGITKQNSLQILSLRFVNEFGSFIRNDRNKSVTILPINSETCIGNHIQILYTEKNSIPKKMKKMFIVVHGKHSAHKICTEDLSKMYYFHKKESPRLPLYQQNSNTEDSVAGDLTTKKIKKQERVFLESPVN